MTNSNPLPPLELAAIVRALGEQARRFDIDLLAACDSTNAVLLTRAEQGGASGSVVIAEQQTAGRGRRGRAWLSAPGDSLTFSLLWRLPPGSVPTGLSLAVGLAVVQALEGLVKLGADETTALQGGRAQDALLAVADGGTASTPQLKWPNDILYSGRKLGGILVELLPGAPHVAVIGIGLNLRLPAAMPEDLRTASAAICESSEWSDCDPNLLLANVLAALLAVLDRFSQSGFAPLRDEWQSRDAYRDQAVRLLSEFAPPREGICRGVDSDGALRLEGDGRIESIISGEVSLRRAE